MSEYQLVPVEPTPEMEQAAEKYWNDRKFKAFSDDPRTWKGLYAAMLSAAPAVQGEPVGWVNSDELDNMLDDRTATLFPVRTGFHGKPVYAPPQPVEHRPCPESIREGAPYDDPAFESLCREHEIWGTAAAAQCAAFWEAGKRVAEQRAAPDVAGLAASLYQACGAYDMPERILDVLSAAANGEPFEHMIDGLLPCVPPSDQDVAALVDALTGLCDEIDNHDIHSAISKTNILWFKRKARAALAAHRKQGGEV